MKVVFAGGGTGGHLYPAIALADAMPERAQITFVGTADRLERTIVPDAGYGLRTIRARPLARRLSLGAVRTLFANAFGTVQSLALLWRVRPDVVVATGGYVCFPVVVAARALRTLGVLRGPIALLEPNAQPGLTNRLLAPLVDEVWGAFVPADPRVAAKFVRTGVPVRAALERLPDPAVARGRLGLDPGRKTLLAMGGSQGARTINDALGAVVRDGALPEGWQLLHLTGEAEYDRMRAVVGASGGGALRPYLSDVADAYAAADLVLARAGASTLGELLAVGLPAILIPYPYAADDHQALNARVFEAAGAAIVLADRGLTAEGLAVALREVTQPDRLAGMRAAVTGMREGNPTASILARIDALLARRTPA